MTETALVPKQIPGSCKQKGSKKGNKKSKGQKAKSNCSEKLNI